MRKAGTLKKSAAASEGGEQGFWPSYADMMSSVALILFFLMLLSYIQNLITGNDLQNTQEVLANTQEELVLTQSKVSAATQELASITNDLTSAKSDLELAKSDLDAAKLDLETAKQNLSEKEKEIKAQAALVDKQEKYLAAANEEILEMRSQMQTIAVLRLSILQQIKESITQVMGDESKISIGDNGNIILNEGVFFDSGKSEIKSASSVVLNQLIDVFSEFLSDENNRKYVDSIVISGHTDSDGTAAENRVLSTDRANSVLNYLLTGKKSELNKYAEYFCAAGYGATRPVATNATAEGKAQNRRIEISIILKDDSVLEVVEEYLALDLPDQAAEVKRAAG